jgi:chemotaxis protein CheD
MVRVARLHAEHPLPETRVHLIQGQYHVSGDPQVVVSTTLGSCIACCMFDPVKRVGGMNHFLLPHGQSAAGPNAVRYGAHAMELLINGLLQAGALKRDLVAKLFGGGRISDYLPDVGGENATFAEHYLRYEGITLLPGSVRGRGARKLQFWPATGRARQLTIPGDDSLFVADSPSAAPGAAERPVEIFEA